MVPLVVVVGDFTLKALEKATWPKSLRVYVRPSGGEKFAASLERLVGLV
jgi:hypothetical protein